MHAQRKQAGGDDAAEVDAELQRAADRLAPDAVRRATAALAAAGTVVTEISTPTRAPDFAEVSDSVPATPARNATMNDSASA